MQIALQDLLTPVGKVHVLSSDLTNHLKSRETVIIEELSGNIDRLAALIRAIDTPPRQVVIEAYVLQINLDKEQRHGVNFERLAALAGTPLSIEMTGFANPNASQALLARVDGVSLNAVLEALRTCTDSRTLASPRLMVINGQERKLQVGEQLGYRTVTTSQSGVTQENVQFLNVGVILSVTPRISPDGRIMLQVNSKVSTGLVNPQTGLPEESTSEVDTDVLLEDGHGIIIGGLIQEEDTVNQSDIPWLSDLKWIGPLFSKRETTKTRSEIVFAILPRIVHDPSQNVVGYEEMYQRATTPIFPETDLPSAQIGPDSSQVPYGDPQWNAEPIPQGGWSSGSMQPFNEQLWFDESLPAPGYHDLPAPVQIEPYYFEPPQHQRLDQPQQPFDRYQQQQQQQPLIPFESQSPGMIPENGSSRRTRPLPTSIEPLTEVSQLGLWVDPNRSSNANPISASNRWTESQATPAETLGTDASNSTRISRLSRVAPTGSTYR